MKRVWWCVVVAVGVTVGWSPLVGAAAGPPEPAKVVVSQSSQGGGQEHVVKVIAVQADGAEGGPKVYTVTSGEPDGRETINLARVLREAREAGDEPENGAWLGVQLSSVRGVSGEVAEEAKGVRVSNVAKDSPAAEAGFEQNDVIIKVDDQAIGDDLGVLIDRIRQAGPGQRVTFTVLRDGELRTLVATLGTRGDAAGWTWLYEPDTDATFSESIESEARILRRGKDGRWIMEHLENLGDLPRDIGAILPGRVGVRTQITIGDDNETSLTTSMTRDGVTITVEREGDGDIVVTRSSTDGGEESVEHYADEEALRTGDEEAYALFKDTKGHIIMRLDGVPGLDFKFDGDFDWLDNLEQTLDLKAEELSDALDRLKDVQIDLDTSGLGFLHGKARRSIHENADGSIEVIVRKGDDELVTHYNDADDLRARDPDTYAKYRDLQSEDE